MSDSLIESIQDNAPKNPVTDWAKGYAQACHDICDGIRNRQPMPVSIERAAKDLRKTHEVYARLTGIRLNAEEVLKQVAESWGLKYVD